VSGRRQDALAKVVAELTALGVKVVSAPADLSDLSQVDPLIDGVETALEPIDVLVNNAGVEAIHGAIGCLLTLGMPRTRHLRMVKIVGCSGTHLPCRSRRGVSDPHFERPRTRIFVSRCRTLRNDSRPRDSNTRVG
jgi:hypothetical protein